MSDIPVCPTPGPGHAARRIHSDDLVLAVGYGLLIWLLAAVGMAGNQDLIVPGLGPWWVLLLIGGCLGVALRQWNTMLMAGICTVSGILLFLAGNVGAFFMFFEVVFALVLFGTDKVARTTSRFSLALGAVLVLAVYLVSGSAPITVVAGLTAAMTLLMPVEWASNVRNARALARSEVAHASALREAAEQRAEAERSRAYLALERERRHMAGELHDVVAARMAAIALQSGAALAGDAQNAPLARIRAEAVAGLEELNAMIRVLQDGELQQPTGRMDSLESLVAAYSSAGGEIGFANTLPAGGTSLPFAAQSLFYRAVNEALLNAARHAPGMGVNIRLEQVNTGVQLHAVNQLRDAEPPENGTGPGTGTGLASMAARAESLGGELRAESNGASFSLFLHLPHANAEQLAE